MTLTNRCCGRKPTVVLYKRSTDARISTGHYFCVRCDRAYSLITGEQLENWAWEMRDGFWQFRMPHMFNAGAK